MFGGGFGVQSPWLRRGVLEQFGLTRRCAMARLGNKPREISGQGRDADCAGSRLDVLLLSERRIADLAAYCLAYEFEDVFASVVDAERVDVADFPALEFSRRVYKLARLAFGSPGLARKLAPSPRGSVALERDFDLFFPVFSHTYQLYSLAAIPNWRQRCRKAACFITEVWSDMLPEYLLELLSQFDHIFIGQSQPAKD